MPDALLWLSGLVVLVLVTREVFTAVLSPSTSLRFSPVIAKLTWQSFRRMAPHLGGRRLLASAGPITVALNMTAWISSLWVGFALLYAPFMTSFVYADDASFGDKGMLDALYVSGVALTTVGFGDIVAGSYALRMLTVLEAASGLAVFTAAISFILGLFPGLILLRANARRFADMGLTDPTTAVRHVLADQSVLGSLHRALLDEQQQRKRFPVQLLFSDPDPADAIPTIVRSAIVMSLASHAIGRAEGERCDLEALDAALARTMDQYERALLGGKHESAMISGPEVERSLAVFRSAAGTADPPMPGNLIAFTSLLRRGAPFIAALDHAFLYEPRPLVPSTDASRHEHLTT